ncbi:uncharacterized protein LOC128228464 [Mya arenaria]|uniref:uncharacterized protein LOC128228464 n=1 Tax=Mya arenaria TaxID=6604 RepID=UPI0022E4CA0B|nr:uncharacterized protein LOC128228464 [Mya arenaria]
MGLKRISESSVLFIIGATLVFVSFVLGIVGIATPVWTQSSTIKNGTSVEYHSGLWRVCSTIDRYHSMEETFCLSRIEASVEGWMQGVQTLEIVGLIFFVVGFVMTLALLLWSSNARLASANPWVLLVAGILLEVGVVIYVVKVDMNILGYSLYLTWVASNGVIVASIIIYCAERRNRRPTSTTVFYAPSSNTNPVQISQPM